MKAVLILISLTFNTLVLACDTLGDRILLEDSKKVEVDVYGHAVVKLLAREVGPVNIFGARVLENYAGFECEVVDVVKLSQGCWEVRVEWSPGADFSGCDVEVSASSGKRYTAFLFMDFHAHFLN
jgi:hypothetical protein